MGRRRLSRIVRHADAGRKDTDRAASVRHSPYVAQGTRTAPGYVAERMVSGPELRPAQVDPRLISTTRVRFPDTEWVLGIERCTEARGYPISVLARHHLVNDSVGGPVLATFCGLCWSGICFDPQVDGSRLLFDLFGLYQGNMAMKDRMTGTVWSQLSGLALVGPLAGARLEQVASTMTKLGSWLRNNPHSRTPAGMRGSSQHPSFTTHQGMRSARGVAQIDRRLDPFQLVVGIDIGGGVAYPIEAEPGELPIAGSDSAAGDDIILLGSPWSWPTPFSRVVDQATAQFRIDGGALVGADSTWSWDGVALDGRLKDTRLTRLPSVLSRWYAWAAHYPDTEIRRLPK